MAKLMPVSVVTVGFAAPQQESIADTLWLWALHFRNMPQVVDSHNRLDLADQSEQTVLFGRRVLKILKN